MSRDDTETISRIFHTRGTLPGLEDGCVLEFEGPVEPAGDDMIVVTLASDEERTLHVEEVRDTAVTVSLMKGAFNTVFTLERIDRRSFRVVLQPHHRDMPEAF